MAGETITYLTNNQSLKAVADAIRTKGGTDAPLEYPAEFVSAIQDIPTGGSAGESDVNFYDYDGTLCASYSAADFAGLTELPANPTHEGLTAQGWNWSLADAKAYVAKYGKLNIGQMYITDDGKTRVYIHLEQGRTNPMLGVCPNGTVDVDWGDGTTHDTLTGDSTSTVQWTPTHNYAAPGDYVIKLSVTGEMGFYGSNSANQYSGLLRYSSSADTRNYVYRNVITKVEIGTGVTSIGGYAFQYCYSLSSITIPDSVTSIGNQTFQTCYHLSSITIPDSVTSIGSYAFHNCYSLSSVTIPESVTSIGDHAFYYCYNLPSIVIPESITRIENYAFYYCYNLSSFVIPDSVTSIGDYAFNYCFTLSHVVIPDSGTSIGGHAFHNCYSLSSITIPDSVTSIGNQAFNMCYSLSSVTIQDGVTSIGDQAFLNCYSLSSITIPDSVTSIGAATFQNCYSIKEYHILPTTPPTLANKSAFQNIPADCIIYVPAASLETYKAATNWSTYASYMQGE